MGGRIEGWLLSGVAACGKTAVGCPRMLSSGAERPMHAPLAVDSALAPGTTAGARR
jgi:hypothetical protein